MPIPRHHLPIWCPVVAGVAAIGVIVGLRATDVFGLSEGFVGDGLLVLAGMIAVAVALDLVLISHGDRHRY